jgi:integrase
MLGTTAFSARTEFSVTTGRSRRASGRAAGDSWRTELGEGSDRILATYGYCTANVGQRRVRQDRLGHADPRTTMGYTHVIGDDHRKVAEQLGGFFAQVRLNLPSRRAFIRADRAAGWLRRLG